MRTSISFLSQNIATGKNHCCALQNAEQQSKLISFNSQAFSKLFPNPKILVQNTIQCFFITLLPLAFLACSGKVQTNKIPQTTKYHLPNTTTPLKQGINETTKNDFEETLKEFFKIKENDNSVNIYKVGIERGHFQ